MAEKFVSERNLKFLLYEVFDTNSLTQYPYIDGVLDDLFVVTINNGCRHKILFVYWIHCFRLAMF